MHQRSRALALGLATLAAVAASIGSASANQATFTVQPGGDITGTAQNVTFTIPDAPGTTCLESVAPGFAKSGSGLPGEGIGRIDSTSLTGCTIDDIGVPLNITVSSHPWPVNVSAVDPANPSQVPGAISGVTATVSSANPDLVCNLSVSAPDRSPATLTGHYDNNTGELVVNDGNLTVHDPDCLGLVEEGDPVTMNARYLLSPSTTITQDQA